MTDLVAATAAEPQFQTGLIVIFSMLALLLSRNRRSATGHPRRNREKADLFMKDEPIVPVRLLRQ